MACVGKATWDDPVPKTYLYPWNGLSLPIISSDREPLCIVKKMEERGKESFKRRDYFDALWKYQHSLNLLASPLVNCIKTMAAVHSNISACCLKLGDDGRIDLLRSMEGFPNHQIMWYWFSHQHAQKALLLHPPPKVASKAFRRRGESFKKSMSFPNNIMQAMFSESDHDNPYSMIINDYVQSCMLQEIPDPKVYYEALLLAVDKAIQVKSEDPMEESFGLSCFDICGEDEDSDGQQDLFPAEEHLYWKKNILKVYFINFPVQHYGHKVLTKEMIIGWMNEWRGGEDSSVPMFVLVDDFKGSDIRIEFSNKSRTYIGNEAAKHPNKATMLLKLQDGPKEAGNPHHHKKYTVLHETGHALGIYHEHQHPDIGTDIFNKAIVEKDIKKEGTNFYAKNFGKMAKKNDRNIYPFHKHSVMMYRVKESWIKSEFHDQVLSEHKYKGFYWPESALTGQLPKEDREGAQNMYKEGGAGVGQPDESCMETDTGAGLPRRTETDNGAMKLEGYPLLKSHRSATIEAVISDMIWLAGELNDDKVAVLTDQQHADVTEVKTLLNEEEKAGIVVKALLNRVKQDAGELKIFVDILKKKPQKFKALIAKLDTCSLSSQ